LAVFAASDGTVMLIWSDLVLQRGPRILESPRCAVASCCLANVSSLVESMAGSSNSGAFECHLCRVNVASRNISVAQFLKVCKGPVINNGREGAVGDKYQILNIF
jgi:hypothetical protein